MKKFRNKYRTDSHRLKGYDYTLNGAYFITICTKNRKHYFGEIINHKMVLNELGTLATEEWQKSGIIRNNIIIDEFIVMPNHIHGIVFLNNNIQPNNDKLNDGERNGDERNDGERNDGRDVLAKRLYENANENENANKNENKYRGNHKKMSEISPSKKSISVMIRFFKRQTSIYGKKINPDFQWQSNYYDHIVRNDKALNDIRKYIINNPRNWKEDEFY